MRVTVSQLAAHVGKSERTIERWIASGKLRATPLPDGSYEVSGPLAEEMSAHGSIEDRLCKIEESQARLESMMAEILEAMKEKQIAPRRHVPSIATPEPAQDYAPIAQPVRIIRDQRASNTSEQESVTSPSTPATGEPKPAELAGYMHINDLAYEIGRSRGALYDQVVKGTYHAVSTPKAKRPREKDWWFSPEEAARVRSDYGKQKE